MDEDYEQQLGIIDSKKEFKERRKNEQSKVLTRKKLNGQFIKQIEEVAGEEKWLWLRDESIKRQTKSLIIAGQTGH